MKSSQKALIGIILLLIALAVVGTDYLAAGIPPNALTQDQMQGCHKALSEYGLFKCIGVEKSTPQVDTVKFCSGSINSECKYTAQYSSQYTNFYFVNDGVATGNRCECSFGCGVYTIKDESTGVTYEHITASRTSSPWTVELIKSHTYSFTYSGAFLCSATAEAEILATEVPVLHYSEDRIGGGEPEPLVGFPKCINQELAEMVSKGTGVSESQISSVTVDQKSDGVVISGDRLVSMNVGDTFRVKIGYVEKAPINVPTLNYLGKYPAICDPNLGAYGYMKQTGTDNLCYYTDDTDIMFVSADEPDFCCSDVMCDYKKGYTCDRSRFKCVVKGTENLQACTSSSDCEGGGLRSFQGSGGGWQSTENKCVNGFCNAITKDVVCNPKLNPYPNDQCCLYDNAKQVYYLGNCYDVVFDCKASFGEDACCTGDSYSYSLPESKQCCLRSTTDSVGVEWAKDATCPFVQNSGAGGGLGLGGLDLGLQWPNLFGDIFGIFFLIILIILFIIVLWIIITIIRWFLRLFDSGKKK